MVKDEDVVKIINELLYQIEHEPEREKREDLESMFMRFIRMLGKGKK